MTVLQRFTFRVTVTLESPFLQTGLANGAYGYDEVPLLGPAGDLIVSGDQIEGFLRQVLEGAGLAEPDRLAWFGAAGEQIEDANAPLAAMRARLKIFDLSGECPDPEPRRAQRIAIDGDTGAVKPGAWQVIALPAAPGRPVNFSGCGRLFAEDRREGEDFIALANAAFQMVPSLGAIKSSGFGRVLAADFDCLDEGRPLAPRLATGAELDAIEIRLTSAQPLLVNTDLRSGNLLDGSEVIPGATIKGAIAHMLEMGDALARHDVLLSTVTVRQAVPSLAGARPRHAPLSLAFDSARLIDVLVTEPSDVPRFAVDWKRHHRESVASAFYAPGNLERHVRTRSAMGPDNTPLENMLFSTRAVAPEGVEWHSAFILPDGSDRELRAQLGGLVEFLEGNGFGIAAIGKSAAEAKVERGPQDRWLQSVELEADGIARVTLQSPAWLLAHDDLFDGAGSRQDLRQAYQRYFTRVANGCELINFIAAQSWAGGAQAVGRRSQLGQGAYYPYLLTQPGSVFRLHGLSPETCEAWMRTGLPVADERRTWRDCLFVPENGFGEVAVDLRDLRVIESLNRVL